MKSPRFSLILPCWNEKRALPYLFEQYGPLSLSEIHSVEVLFVDNGSEDGTAEEFKRLMALHPEFEKGFRYVRVDVNKGVGGGLKSGARVAQGKDLIFCHADEQYGRTMVEAAIEKYIELEKRGDGKHYAVKGVRSARTPREVMISRSFDTVATVLGRTLLYDINAQPKIFPAPASPTIWDKAPDDYCIDLFVLLTHKKMGFHWESVKVAVQERVSGESSWQRSWSSVARLARRYVGYLVSFQKQN